MNASAWQSSLCDIVLRPQPNLPSPLSTHLDNPPAATMSESPRPRSRFDKAETDRPPRSRFDRGERRSRSPSSREPDSRRTRSPVAREGTDSPATAEAKKAKALDAAAAAAAAAARINAQIQAKKGIQHVDVPPIRAVRYPLLSPPLHRHPHAPANLYQAPSPPVVRSPAVNAPKNTSGEIFQQDGDFIKDIEINDLKNRYTLTKGAVQKRVISFCAIPLILPGLFPSIPASGCSSFLTCWFARRYRPRRGPIVERFQSLQTSSRPIHSAVANLYCDI